MRDRAITYLSSFAIVIALTVVKLTVPALDRMPFMLYLAAVLFAAWRGGRGPAALTIVLSAVAGEFFFSEPRFTLELQREELAHATVFALEGIVITEITRLIKRAKADVRSVVASRASALRSIGDAVIATTTDLSLIHI